MKQYLDMLNHVLTNGVKKGDRTGTGTLSVFGYQFRHNLKEGFPLLTTKAINRKAVMNELVWFLRGETNIKTLDSKIWDAWADENGDLGPIYGKMWRDWGGVDQIATLVNNLKTNPNSRRHVVSAWNPVVLPLDDLKPHQNPVIGRQALAPCHCLFQMNVTNEALSCHMYQRSADIFLGVPFNIASYALLTHMLAEQTGYDVGDLIISYGDLHLYLNHVNQAKEQLGRKPGGLPASFNDPNYCPQPPIKAEISI